MCAHACYNTCVEVRGQLIVSVLSFYHVGPGRSNSSLQAWQQVPLLTGSSHNNPHPASVKAFCKYMGLYCGPKGVGP